MLQGAVELGDHLAHGLGHLTNLVLLLYTHLDGQVLLFSNRLQGQGRLRDWLSDITGDEEGQLNHQGYDSQQED